MEYCDVTAYINRAQKFGSRLDLSRIRSLCARLGNPQNKLKYIHVAGTNGKGSVSVFCEQMLIAAGYKVGLYTSPFIYEFNERIRVNHTAISDDSLTEVMDSVVSAVDEMLENGEEHPTEFELITAAAFLYFYRQQCDIVVLEVGLGGILDATNVIDSALVSVICKIGKDHTDILGDSFAQIAENKAGIIKQGTSVCVYPEQPDEALEVIARKAEQMQSNVVVCDISALRDICVTSTYSTFSYAGYLYRLRQGGEYQIKNAITALNVMALLESKGFHVSEQAKYSGLYHAYWPARFDVVNTAPYVILDGSHNPDGMEAFCESVRTCFPDKKIICVFGMLKDKDYSLALHMLQEVAQTVIVTEVDSPRKETAENLFATAKNYFQNVIAEPDNFKALQKAQQMAKTQDIIAAVGSLYMMKNMKQSVDRLF